ncbi:hypothetical protein FRC12_020556 [Ceratobasidium sp. 428]|nr:hypothetical protein FRC12_020556 [Ceratobasidium sp. 428]
MRVEVVLPAPPRRLSNGKTVSPQRPVEAVQQPTPDPSSLDRSPGLEFGSNEDVEEIASGDSTYVPSSQHSDDEESPVDRPRDGHGRFMAQTPGSVSTSLARVRPDPPPSGSSVSLGSFHFEKPRRKRRAFGFKPSGLGKASTEGSRQADATQDGDREHTVVGAVEPATERSTAEQRDKTVLQGRSTLQTPSLNTVTPRVTVGSTPHHAFDFTPGSGFGSRFESSFRPTGSYAQSTPYARGDRQSLFGQPNQSGMPTGPIDLDLDGGSSEALGGRIPYSAKGKARDEGERNEIVPESSQPPDPLRYREISVDSSVIVSMSSPGKSLRTERLPTPRATRISAAIEEDSDEEPDDPDPPSSPSANRQSLSGSIKGRGLSSILELRKQAWNRSSLPQDASSREMTTRLDAASQEVLDSPLSHSASSWPEAPTSATTVTSAGSGEPSKSLQAQPHPAPGLQSYNEADEEEMIVRASVSEDYPFDKQSIHLPHSDGLVPHDYDASVHFDGPSRAPIRRSATPILRGRLSPGEHTDSDIEPDELEEPPLADLVQRGRSSSISADSSGPDDVEEQELIEDGEPEQGRDDPLPIRTNASVLGSRHARDALSQAGYVGHEQSTLRFAPSPSSSARSTSRSLSRPRDYYGPNRSGRLDRSTSVGDRTTGLSRSQMMAEASMHEDWEPPARRQLKPRKWTDHDWRMLAHYLRRVQKSQALAKGLSSREELDLMMVNVHAVVNRFVEEEAHGIKLEGEWAR